METLRTAWARLFAADDTSAPIANTQAAGIPARTNTAYKPVTPQPSYASASTTSAAAENDGEERQIVYQTIQQPVIERVLETQHVVTQGGISEAVLGEQLSGLENKLRSLIFSQGSQQSAQTSAVYNAVAQSQRIDNLANVTITNPTITGGSVEATSFSGTIGASQGGTGTTTAPVYGQLLLGNASGGYDLVATSTLGLGGSGANTGSANDWSALQIFSAGASTTNQSVFGSLWVGGTATTTILGNATSTFGAGIQTTALNITGSATSTAANGFNLASGCYAVNGVCIGTSGGASSWGGIAGTLSSQTDLQAALDAKLSLTNWYATTTDALDEGITNLYFTNNRVASVIAGTTTTALAEGLNLYFTDARADQRVAAGIAATTTDALDEGVTNQYWTGSRFNSAFAGKSTSDLAEGSNLYFTTGRVASVLAGTTTDALVQGATNRYYSSLLFAGDLAGTTTDAIDEGSTNRYFTNARADERIAAGFAATTTDALDEGVTNQYWTNIRFDNRLSATTSLPSITSLVNLSTVSAALSGIVRATAGALSTALVNLASDVTGILPVANGGTGWANLASDTVLLGNGTGVIATTTRGNLTETGSSIFTITGGTGALLGSGATIQVAQASGSASGFLSSADWTTFNSKQAALGFTPANSTRTISAGAGLSGGGDLSADRSLSLNLASANAWTGLQQFTNASTTLLSVSNGTATTTILGNATSTFGAGIQTTALNITGSATSTAANGFNLAAGCFAVGGVCVGGAASQWTTSGSNIYFTTGSVLIGTTTAGRPLTVFNTSANPQQRVSYDATRYAEWYADAAGAFNLTATGKTLNFLDGNFYLCDGGACPTTPVQGYPAFTTNGNLVAGGTIYAGGFGPATCPSGMIPVPASAADGQQGFCVDKYETQSSSGNAVSVQGGSPWATITQYDARAQCIRAGKHLITEKEWMAIAHNAENVGWNWNGGVAGTNQMSDGHSDNTPASALATAADSSPCSGTGQTCDLTTWSDQRRTYKLSNGEYIWDLGGNVWEWVDQANQEDYPIANSAAAGWQACSTSGDGVCGNTRTTNDQWYRGGTTALRGFFRGGGWGVGANDGAFTLYLHDAPSSTGTNLGFRCSR